MQPPSKVSKNAGLIPDEMTQSNNPETWRVQRWREANRDRYNARQREAMRRYRERKKVQEKL